MKPRLLPALGAALLTAFAAGAVPAAADSAPRNESPAAQVRESPLTANTGESVPPPASNATAPGSEPAAAGLTLAESFRIAVERSERIGRAHQDYNQAVAVKRNALSAVLPQLSLENVYFRQNQVEISPTGGVGSAFTFSDSRNDLYLQLTQPIFSGLRDRNFLASARHSIEASRHGIEEARRLLYADLSQAFFTVLQRQGEVETLEDSVSVERERVREVRARQEVGLARRTEYLLVEAQLAEDESDLTRARNDLQVALQRLGFLMGRPVAGPLRDDIVLPDPLGEEPPSFEEALQARSDMRQLERQVEAARYQVAVSRGSYFPSIDLEARNYLDRQNVSEFAQETDWTAEVTFSFPIFDGGRARAGVFNARADLDRATLSRDELARQIALEIETVWRTLQSDLARLRTLESSVASADESYRLVQEEYRAGLATNLEVITAHNLFLSSSLERERQRYQVKLDWVALELARGRLAQAGDESGAAGAPAGPAGAAAAGAGAAPRQGSAGETE